MSCKQKQQSTQNAQTVKAAKYAERADSFKNAYKVSNQMTGQFVHQAAGSAWKYGHGNTGGGCASDMRSRRGRAPRHPLVAEEQVACQPVG